MTYLESLLKVLQSSETVFSNTNGSKPSTKLQDTDRSSIGAIFSKPISCVPLEAENNAFFNILEKI